MNRKEKLYQKAKESPNNLSYRELCLLAEMSGFKFRNHSGSHKIYKHPEINKMMNFQSDKRDSSKAKRYQIKQLVSIIDEFKLMEK